MSAELRPGGVRGAFLTIEEVASAVDALEDGGFEAQDITVFSPIPTPELEDHIERPPSPIRRMTLIGGILGCITGFVLTYWTFFDWPLRVGGKPIGSFPVTVVIMFELTVLLGGLFTLAGVFIFSRIPALTSKAGYHPRFSDDLFGIFVHTVDDETSRRAQSVLDQVGALEADSVPV